MIAQEIIREIEQLLHRGDLSRRKIAHQLGVSRGTVNAVANGTRARRNARRVGPIDRFEPPHGPPRRCPTCGRLVQMPCLACHLQKLSARRRNASRDPRERP